MFTRAHHRVIAALTAAVVLTIGLSAGDASATPADLQHTAIIGDSITTGYGVPTGSSWVDLLEADDPTATNYLRLAHVGATVRDWRTIYAADLTQFGSWQPTTVVIGLGGNDWYIQRSTTQYQADLTALIAAVRSYVPTARIILWHYYPFGVAQSPGTCDISPCTGAYAPAYPAPTWHDYANAARNAAIANYTGYIDNSVTAPSGLPWSAYYGPDHAHLTVAGHQQEHTDMSNRLQGCC